MAYFILKGKNKEWPAKETSVIHKRRLERLRNALRVISSIPPKAFYLETVFNPVPKGRNTSTDEYFEKRKEVIAKIGKVPLGRCGAIGCVFGWAGIDPWFRKRGLFTDPETEDTNFRLGRYWVKPSDWFYITIFEAEDLFFGNNPKANTTLRATKRKLKLLIKKYQKKRPINAKSDTLSW